jgi:hypothetical protein
MAIACYAGNITLQSWEFVPGGIFVRNDNYEVVGPSLHNEAPRFKYTVPLRIYSHFQPCWNIRGNLGA